MQLSYTSASLGDEQTNLTNVNILIQFDQRYLITADVR